VLPNNVLADDYAFLFDTSTTTTDTIPAGWSSIVGTTTTGIRTNVSYKKLVSGDIGATITGMAGTTRKALIVVRGNVAISSITISTPTAEATTSAPANQTIAVTNATEPAISFGVFSSTGARSTTGMTNQNNGNSALALSESTSFIYVIPSLAVTPRTTLDHVLSQADTGTNILQGFYVQFNG
jgi:hypothetical protein